MSDAGYRVIVGGAATREEAEENGKEIQKITDEDRARRFTTLRQRPGDVSSVGPSVRVKRRRSCALDWKLAGFDATIDGPPAAVKTVRAEPAPLQTIVRFD